MAKKFEFKKKAVAEEPIAPVKGASTAMKAVLTIVLAHTAEMFEGVVEAIADHYKLDKEEMMNVVKEHPSFTGPVLHPVLDAMAWLPEELAPVVAPQPAEPVEPAPVAQPKKKVVVFKKKKSDSASE